VILAITKVFSDGHDRQNQPSSPGNAHGPAQIIPSTQMEEE
jgi:hypothetical protein